jgi:hypothetical protein
LLTGRQAVDRRHAFEATATDDAPRDWCKLDVIDLVD